MIDFKNLIHRKLRHDNQQESDSHVEPNTNVFHPSSLSRCERQCTIQKLGLEDHSINTLWNFYLGKRQHGDLREWFEGLLPGVKFEVELKHSILHKVPKSGNETGIHLTGRCDVLDEIEGVVYDFKTRKSWNGFDGASYAHKDQLTTYMKMADVQYGQLVYVVKSAPWDDVEPIIRTWPEDELYEFDVDRWEDVEGRARRIHDELELFKREHDRLPGDRSEVPFDDCGCWLCSSEGNGDSV